MLLTVWQSIPSGVLIGLAVLSTLAGNFVLVGSFPVPPGYVGVPNGPGIPEGSHLVIVAAPARTGSLAGRFCLHTRAGVKISVRGRAAEILDCPVGSALMSGHVALSWTEDGISTVASLHGHSDLNRQLVTSIATHMQFVT